MIAKHTNKITNDVLLAEKLLAENTNTTTEKCKYESNAF